MPKTKRTFQPKKLKRKKTYGFRERNSSENGKKVLKRRLLKGRHTLAL